LDHWIHWGDPLGDPLRIRCRIGDSLHHRYKVLFFLIGFLGLTSCKKPLPVLFQAPSFVLTDQGGAKVSLENLKGKVWVADFIFTRCAGVCPLLTQKMADLEKSLSQEPDLRFISFTVDPETDTPQKLSAYAHLFHADSRRWFFLTGPVNAVEEAIVKGFKISMEKASDFQVIHGEKFILVDREGRIRGYFDTDPTGLQWIHQGIISLLKEKGGN